jgi:hypothetical protein
VETLGLRTAQRTRDFYQGTAISILTQLILCLSLETAFYEIVADLDHVTYQHRTLTKHEAWFGGAGG